MHNIRPRHGPPEQGWFEHIDGSRWWCAGAFAKTRTREAREALFDLGLRPGPRYPKDKKTGKLVDAYGIGFNVSLAVAWTWPVVDLEARAKGWEPRDLLRVVEILETAEAVSTGLEPAANLHGYDADLAHGVGFPRPLRECSPKNLCRLRGDTKKPGRHYPTGASYERGPRSTRNLVAYSSLPAKYDVSGPNVSRFEVRLRGPHLPVNLRQPRGLLCLARPGEIWKLIAQNVRTDP